MVALHDVRLPSFGICRCAVARLIHNSVRADSRSPTSVLYQLDSFLFVRPVMLLLSTQSFQSFRSQIQAMIWGEVYVLNTPHTTSSIMEVLFHSSDHGGGRAWCMIGDSLLCI